MYPLNEYPRVPARVSNVFVEETARINLEGSWAAVFFRGIKTVNPRCLWYDGKESAELTDASERWFRICSGFGVVARYWQPWS